MRFRTVVTAVVLCLAALPALAQQSRVEQIPLKHLNPGEVAEQLSRALPEGVTQVKPYDLTNSLLVAGTEAGIAALKQRVSALDIPPVHVRVESDFYTVTPEALATEALAAFAELRKEGVVSGPAAEKLADVLLDLRKQGPRCTVISPRILAVSGRLACIGSAMRPTLAAATPRPEGDQPNQGPTYSLCVVPVAKGDVVQTPVIIQDGKREGITLSGRMASEFVTVPVGQRVAFWLTPTKDAPNDLVVVLRFDAGGPDLLSKPGAK